MHSRLKRLFVGAALTVTAITGSPVAGTAAQATPAELVLVPREVPAQAPQDATAADPVKIGDVAYNVLYWTSGEATHRGFVWIRVYSNQDKRLVVCDEQGDNKEPTLQVDPSHGEPLEYQDPNGSHAGCLGYTINYPVRKFRIGLHLAGDATVALEWEDWFSTPPEGPLPHPDF